MRLLHSQTLDLVEQHGDIVLGALLTGHLSALDLIKKGGKDGFVSNQKNVGADDN